eukprot:4351417-Prymnesium_polylepis.1
MVGLRRCSAPLWDALCAESCGAPQSVESWGEGSITTSAGRMAERVVSPAAAAEESQPAKKTANIADRLKARRRRHRSRGNVTSRGEDAC